MPVDIQKLKLAAAQGDTKAQMILGNAYWVGFDVSQDLEKAEKLLRQSAENGDAYAQYLLGNFYLSNSALSSNSIEVVYWWREAAEQGFIPPRLDRPLPYPCQVVYADEYLKATKGIVPRR